MYDEPRTPRTDCRLKAIYLPQMILSSLTSTSFAHTRPNAMGLAGYLHGFGWIAQFIGHGVAEKRAPALLDNLIGGMCVRILNATMLTPVLIKAIVLAPFFVHLEILFELGYKPALAKKIQNLVSAEITRIRIQEGRKKRGAADAVATAKGEKDGVELKEL